VCIKRMQVGIEGGEGLCVHQEDAGRYRRRGRALCASLQQQHFLT
jgi:hypothetical protein